MKLQSGRPFIEATARRAKQNREFERMLGFVPHFDGADSNKDEGSDCDREDSDSEVARRRSLLVPVGSG